MSSLPSSFSRRALVCVTGLSPQIVTETLYALFHAEDGPFLPTEMHVVTTRTGARLVEERLLANGTGPLHALLAELGLPERSAQPALHVHQISREGSPLDDIESPQDNQAAANCILDVVATLARDPQCAIHASIAGGRKSMGFLLGYAMSLVGRAQDRVSHVLISRDFEGHRDFFYPPSVPRVLKLADGREVSTSDARITLAHIPVVHMTDGLRSEVQAGRSYDELVRLKQLELGPLTVVVRPGRCEVEVNGIGIALAPTEMAWYFVFAQRCVETMRDPAMPDDDARLIEFSKQGPDVSMAWLQRLFSRVIDAELPAAERIDPDYLKPKLSEMRAKFEQRLGRAGARRVCIAGPGERRVRDGRYGLLLTPGQLRFE